MVESTLKERMEKHGMKAHYLSENFDITGIKDTKALYHIIRSGLQGQGKVKVFFDGPLRIKESLEFNDGLEIKETVTVYHYPEYLLVDASGVYQPAVSTLEFLATKYDRLISDYRLAFNKVTEPWVSTQGSDLVISYRKSINRGRFFRKEEVVDNITEINIPRITPAFLLVEDFPKKTLIDVLKNTK